MKSNLLSSDEITALIRPGGPLQLLFPSFEYRTQQETMMRTLIDAFNERGIALVEAATGTGKSLAYLLPAAIKALFHGERVVISTRTIALQEQILHKDLPVVAKLIGKPIHAVLVKGMGNYLCLKKLEEAEGEPSQTAEEAQELAALSSWAKRTKEGSRGELSFTPSASLWERVGAESDSCQGKRCPHFESCFFLKARKRAEDAALLVSNHSLLFADLALKQKVEGVELLPPYKHVVFDEAHHLEDVATDFFSTSISRFDILKLVGRLASEKSGESTGRVQQLRKCMNRHYAKGLESELFGPIKALSEEFSQKRRALLHHLSLLFDLLADFYSTRSQGEEPLRLLQEVTELPIWKERVTQETRSFSESISSFISLLEEQCHLMEKIDHDAFRKESDPLLFEIKGQLRRLERIRVDLMRILLDPPKSGSVRYLASIFMGNFPSVAAVESPLEIKEQIQHSFENLDTAILASATLATGESFSFIKGRLGIGKESARPLFEQQLSSPFDFKSQCSLFIPTDLPLPGERGFEEEAIEEMREAIRASRGGAFLLFTSFAFLNRTFSALQPLIKEGYQLLRQGETPKRVLLQQFISSEKAVLLGADSFWEGIDVQGERLRLVIIPKLPFKVPGEPLFEARGEALKQAGHDPFRELALPLAALKLKQGFGRLIRHKADRGAALILDGRLLRKGYGKTLLKSLPDLPLISLERQALRAELRRYFRSLK